MQAVCFSQVGVVQCIDRPEPEVQSQTDAIVKVELAGLCGSDLHPFWGRETGLDPGTVMGHEMVGRIVALGDRVQGLGIGDRVMAPFTTNCGQCFYCRRGLTSRCVAGQLFGWVSKSQGLQGCQAEYVRVPLASTTLMKVPETVSDYAALLLGDNLSTGFYCADMAGVDAESTVAVVGCGTVGLLGVLAARYRGAEKVFAFDLVESRRQRAAALGAVALPPDDASLAKVMNATEGRGADAVMELVGMPEAQRFAFRLLRPGGTLAVIGCHCTPEFPFSPVDVYDKNLTYRTGRCPARAYMSELSELVASNAIEVDDFITHEFRPEDCARAYEVFSQRLDQCQKAVFRFEV